jgi:hypothetical protein
MSGGYQKGNNSLPEAFWGASLFDLLGEGIEKWESTRLGHTVQTDLNAKWHESIKNS